jgi:fused signal recognition particle receptor
MQELERILLEADTGITTTRALMEKLRAQVASGQIKQGSDLKIALQHELTNLLESKKYHDENAKIFLMVGVNGTGKTTFTSKLANRYTKLGKKVLLAAADTFRAAATHQLQVWAERSGAECITGPEGSDPAAVVYAACERFVSGSYDILIIDTAGRLQNKTNLMRELEKIRKVISRHIPDVPVVTLLTIDSMLGQNSFDQARLFNEATQVNGIVLTKMDGTGKGGIVFAITNEIKIPIAYVSFGEHMDDLARFESESYVKELLEG